MLERRSEKYLLLKKEDTRKRIEAVLSRGGTTDLLISDKTGGRQGRIIFSRILRITIIQTTEVL